MPPSTSSIAHPSLHRQHSETPGLHHPAGAFSGILPPHSSNSNQSPSPALSLSRGDHERIAISGNGPSHFISIYKIISDGINFAHSFNHREVKV